MLEDSSEQKWCGAKQHLIRVSACLLEEMKTGPLLRNTKPCVAETGGMGPCIWPDLPKTRPDGRVTDKPGPRFHTRAGVPLECLS